MSTHTVGAMGTHIMGATITLTAGATITLTAGTNAPTHTIMTTTDDAFLTALRLSDSFLPVGAYTASYGVEQFVNEGRVETPAELGELIEGYLRRIVGPADTVALAAAHRATVAGDVDGVLAADERLHAATLPAECRESATKAGTKLLELFRETDGDLFGEPDSNAGSVAAAFAAAVSNGETPGSYPVALGVVTARAGLDRRTACLVGAYSFVTELLGAAQRLGRFGHTAVQTILAALRPVAREVCDAHVDADLDRLASFAPLVETMSMRHERADRRLFMS